MARFQSTARSPVAAPAAEVWEVLSDTARYAEWVAATDEVTRTDGPAREGSTYDEINPIAGPWKGRSHWTVTEFDAPHRQVHRGEGIAPTVKWLQIEMAVTPAGDSACEAMITLSGETALGPVGVLMLKALKGQIDRDNRETVENLAALVSARSPV
jgi:carbon monoxide dehydrogenase subunit G